ncbi:serine hydrolase domain-containing protein [Candidatus Zixiibacteriota bacterium]
MYNRQRKCNITLYLYPFIILFFILLCGCEKSLTEPNNELEPVWTSNEWQTATPLSQGVDSVKLMEMSQAIENGDLGRLNSIVIIRNGKLIYEYYYGKMHDDSLHCLFSATKSFTSAVFGIALSQGIVDSVSEKLLDIFPEYPFDSLLNKSELKKDITIEHLLTMSSGIESTELEYEYADPRNTFYQVWNSYQPVKTLLDMPMDYNPGEKFDYNSSLTLTLGLILEKYLSTGLEQYFNKYLFEPMGITNYKWYRSSSGLLGTHGELYMPPREMAKLGQLYLDKGVWRNQQIIPADWVNQSVEEKISIAPEVRYGYQWWLYKFTKPDGELTEWCPYASGLWGQFINVIEEFNMVVVITSTPNIPERTRVDLIIEDYIFCAIQ